MPTLITILGMVALMAAQSLLSTTTSGQGIAPDLSQIPLAFVPNVGQTDPSVQFQANDMGGTAFFTSNEVVLRLSTPDRAAPSVVRLRFEGANPSPTLRSENALPGTVNYLTGSDPAQWYSQVPTYAGIVYEEIYPGIDLHYEGSSGRLKSTYVVAPGADPAAIRWHYQGSNVRIDAATGNLLIGVPAAGSDGTLVEQAPIAWQVINGKQIPVDVRYTLQNGSIGFALGAYDPAHRLVIDPELIYSTFVGGSALDDGEGIGLDAEGNIYVVGSTLSPNFPTASAAQDAQDGAADTDDVFVFKLDPAGDTLLYSTYLGGGENDRGTAIDVDGSGNVYVSGATYSADFPTTQNALQGECANSLDEVMPGLCLGDAFTAKLDAEGALLYSTYLGGSALDEAHGIAVDGSGAAYVTGFTSSTDFLSADADEGEGKDADVFAVKLAADGSTAAYVSVFGGSQGDVGTAVAVDDDGSAYVAGLTASDNFPTQSAAQPLYGGDGDAFATKLNANGDAMLYSTYLGGDGEDKAYDIAVDDAGHAFVTGATESSNFPTQSAWQADHQGGFDAFVTKLGANGGSFVYSTYLGGSVDDRGNAIALNDAGHAYVTGSTHSANFPTENAISATLDGTGDAFVTKLGESGNSLVYSTFLGGSLSDSGDGIAVGGGNAFVAGTTYSDDFPTIDPLQTNNAGSADAFVVAISDEGGEPAPPPPDEPDLTGSTKAVSQSSVTPGETFSYTIVLRNSGTADASVDVVDQLPAEVEYVAGSAPGASHDAAAGTLTWMDVAVSAGDEVSLTYEVSAGDVSEPTTAVNSATITSAAGDVVRKAPVLIVPDDAPVPPAPILAASTKIASRQIVTPGETFSYTLVLRNSSDVSTTVDVVDRLPDALSYVPGSAPDAVYDEEARTLTWSDISVSAGGEVTLTYEVTVEPIDAAAVVLNEATISTDEESTEVWAAVLIVPEPQLFPNLRGSYKTASQHVVAPTELFSYTIVLHNSGTADASAGVVDQLPDGVSYVPGSAPDVVFDEEARTLAWSDVSVPSGGRVSLTFQVTADPVDVAQTVVNRVTISSEETTLERQAVVLVVPDTLPDDVRLPSVESLIIGDADVLYDPAVTLHISATDDVGVTQMKFEEWQLTTTPVARWERVQSSGWVPYANEYDWTLSEGSGTKFVSAWVADEAGNVSVLDSNSADFASLLLPGETVAMHEMLPYLVSYEAGVDVTATLTPSAGDADLYVWFPGNYFLPDAKSTNANGEVDEVSFTTPRAGTYLFLVYAYTEATYDLAITPAGGPDSTVVGPTPDEGRQRMGSQVMSNKGDELTTEPVLSRAGLDPMSDIESPAAPGADVKLFIPVVQN